MPLQNVSTGRPLRKRDFVGARARALLEQWPTQAEAPGAGLVRGASSGGCLSGGSRLAHWGSKDALGLRAQSASGRSGTADDVSRVGRAVPGSRSQPGGADNSGLPR